MLFRERLIYEMNFSNSSLNKGLFERKRFVKEVIKENLHFEIK